MSCSQVGPIWADRDPLGLMGGREDTERRTSVSTNCSTWSQFVRRSLGCGCWEANGHLAHVHTGAGVPHDPERRVVGSSPACVAKTQRPSSRLRSVGGQLAEKLYWFRAAVAIRKLHSRRNVRE